MCIHGHMHIYIHTHVCMPVYVCVFLAEARKYLKGCVFSYIMKVSDTMIQLLRLSLTRTQTVREQDKLPK